MNGCMRRIIWSVCVGAALSASAVTRAFSLTCVGDSITEGGAAFTTYRIPLAEQCAAKGWEVVFRGSRATEASGTRLRHEGYGGNTAEQVAAKFATHFATNVSDVVFIHSGHNHFVDEGPIPGILGAYRSIVETARAANPRVTLLLARPITSGKLPKYSYLPELGEGVAALAAELDTPASRALVVDAADGFDWHTDTVADRVHPNAAGAAKIARKIVGALEAFFASREAVYTAPNGLLVEAESFAQPGGWANDTQSVERMGSPYLLAHGLGVPVADATTRVTIPTAGAWRVWVRTRDWTPDWSGEKPGRFRVTVNGVQLAPVFGTTPSDWGWVDGGTVTLPAAAVELRLTDLTGFDGRCDALYFTQDLAASVPPEDPVALARWRAQARGEAGTPEAITQADLVVVGGGIAGTCAAIAAAESGLSVALVQDRAMLGGNASGEIRVKTQGEVRHRIVQAVANTKENTNPYAHVDDTNRLAFVSGFTNIAVYTGWRAYGAVTNGTREIVGVDGRDVVTGARRRFVAPLYVDATGDGWLGYWAGAAWRMGREAKTEYNESLAQTLADTSTMGNSAMWTSRVAAGARTFPDVPWALPVSGTRSATSGSWKWEAGLGVDENTIWNAEMLRDRLLRAVYGSFWRAKQNASNANRELDWVPFNAGKRESRRILGDYVVRQADVEKAVWFEDAIGTSTWSIDLHFYEDASGFIAGTKQVSVPRWYMPYRALCCRDVPNLFLAGRCASFTHVAMGSSRVMNTGGQMGVAVGYAAGLCRKYGCRPRDIYRDPAKTEELQKLIGGTWPQRPDTGLTGYSKAQLTKVIVDNVDAQVSGTWTLSSSESERYGANYLHNGKVANANTWVWYNATLPEDGVWRLFQYWNGNSSRSEAVPIHVVTLEGTVTVYDDMTSPSGGWKQIGLWRFGSNPAATVRTDGTTGFVIADAFQWVRVAGETLVDNSDSEGVEISGQWVTSSYNANRYGSNYLHSDKKAGADLWVKYTPNLPTGGVYQVKGIWNSSEERAKHAVYEITHADGVTRVTADQTVNSGQWTILGAWRFEAGRKGSVRILTEGSEGEWVIADAVLFSPQPDLTDLDGNGLPDAWERANFLVCNGVDPAADPDGDGYTNRDEWWAGSDPNDARSVFRIDSATVGTARRITLSWPSCEGRTYTVWRANRLGDPFMLYRDGIEATPPENEITLPSDDADSAFYRIGVR